MSEGVDMNSPAETHGAILNAIVRRFAAARLLAADEGDPDVLLAALDRALDAARVAVVRPPDELATTVRAMIEDGHPCGSRAADEWFGIISRRLDEPTSAVVRPTRDQFREEAAKIGMTTELFHAIADEFGGATNIRVRGYVGWLRSWAHELAAGPGVAVSDSHHSVGTNRGGNMNAEKLRAVAAWIGERAGRYDAVGIALALALETWADELEVSREEGEGWEDTEIAMRAVLGADDARSALHFLQARGWRPPFGADTAATREDEK